MPLLIDLLGQCFGRLTVISRSENRSMGKHRGTAVAWNCRCSCGQYVAVRAGKLRSGHTKSCGCFHKERSSAASYKHGQSSYPNSGRATKEYNTWAVMRRRCQDDSCDEYKNYGGRGISVCDSWDSFEHFYADMGDAPSSSHSIDRIDVNGDYCKSNCRWATVTQQARNRRNTTYLTANGETLPLQTWAERQGIKGTVIHARLKRGWGVDKAIFTPLPVAPTK